MKNIIIVTGGAGFIGSNLIETLLNKTNYQIYSLDNYIAGNKKNHIKNKKVKYFNGSTKDFDKFFNKFKKKIKAVFHFGEFSRIAQSFKMLDKLIESNIYGSTNVVNFCKANNIRIIYSATSAAFGNNFDDQNLSPYSFTKTTILNLILNYHEWYGLNYNIVYFYNVYGGRQIVNHKMAAVIGIFEHCKKNNLVIPIVRPGTQSRVFTHVEDVVDGTLKILKDPGVKHLLIRANKSYSILNVAKMFNHKYKLIGYRPGERFASTFPKTIRGNKVNIHYGKKKLKDYIKKNYESF